MLAGARRASEYPKGLLAAQAAPLVHVAPAGVGHPNDLDDREAARHWVGRSEYYDTSDYAHLQAPRPAPPRPAPPRVKRYGSGGTASRGAASHGAA